MAIDGQRLVTLSSIPGNVQVWDKFRNKCIKLKLKNKYVAVTFSANGGTIAAVLESEPDYTVEIWDMGLNHFSTIHYDLSTSGCSISLSANGKRLIAGLNNGIIEVRESRTGHLMKVQQCELARAFIKSPTITSTMFSAISLDGEQIAWRYESTHERTKIFTNNVCTDILREFQCPEDMFSLWRLAFSQNGKRLAAVTRGRRGAIWDVVTGVCLRTWDLYYEIERIWKYGVRIPNSNFINLDFTTTADLPEFENRDDRLTKYRISSDGVWVIRYNKKLLWIPPDYRPNDAAAAGSKIAFGRESGHPYVIGFSDDGLS
jgi:WD40 repeat protein